MSDVVKKVDEINGFVKDKKRYGSKVGSVVYDVTRAKEAMRYVQGIVTVKKMDGADGEEIWNVVEQVVKYGIMKMDNVMDWVLDVIETMEDNLLGAIEAESDIDTGILDTAKRELEEVDAETERIVREIRESVNEETVVGEKRAREDKKGKRKRDVEAIEGKKSGMGIGTDPWSGMGVYVGEKLRNVARAYGITPEQVKDVWKGWGRKESRVGVGVVLTYLVLEKMGGKATDEEIARAMGIWKSTVQRNMQYLMRMGVVEYRNGEWVIVERKATGDRDNDDGRFEVVKNGKVVVDDAIALLVGKEIKTSKRVPITTAKVLITLAVLREARVSEISRLIDIGGGTVNMALGKLIEQGLVAKDGRGQYRITEKGLDVVKKFVKV